MMDIHPTLALFPELNQRAYDLLKQSVARVGFESPLEFTIVDGKSLIVNGRSLLRISQELNLELPRIRVPAEQAEQICLQRNFGRRMLTVDQQMAILALMVPWEGKKSFSLITWPRIQELAGAYLGNSALLDGAKLRQAWDVGIRDLELLHRVCRGEVTLRHALDMLGPDDDDKPDDDDPDDDDDDIKPEPPLLSREYYLSKVLETLEKAHKKLQRVTKYDSSDPSEVASWLEDIRQAADEISDTAMDMIGETDEEQNGPF